VRQTDLARPRPLPAADQARVRDGVVTQIPFRGRRAEGPVADQRDVARARCAVPATE
jgi:hypothetical protein